MAVDRSENHQTRDNMLSGAARENNGGNSVASAVELQHQQLSAETPPRRKINTRTSRKSKSKKLTFTHSYHDHCDCHQDRDAGDKILSRDTSTTWGPRGGVATPFPVKLHVMLSRAQIEMFDHIVSWQPHGRCFKVHDVKQFIANVMPRWFKQSKITSFQRQLNLYGFSRLTTGPDRGGYYHEMFLRGHVDLCHRMIRTRVKGTGVKSASSPETEPDFFSMTTCVEIRRAGDWDDLAVDWSDFRSKQATMVGNPIEFSKSSTTKTTTQNSEYTPTFASLASPTADQPADANCTSLYALSSEPFTPNSVVRGADDFFGDVVKHETASSYYHATPVKHNFDGMFDELTPRLFFSMSDEFEGKRFHSVEPAFFEW